MDFAKEYYPKKEKKKKRKKKERHTLNHVYLLQMVGLKLYFDKSITKLHLPSFPSLLRRFQDDKKVGNYFIRECLNFKFFVFKNYIQTHEFMDLIVNFI